MTDTKLTKLIQNILTKEQFDSATVSPDEQYFITDDDYFATKNDLATKQNTISDLSTIRSNAQTGANLAPQVAVNTQRIEDLTTARIPDVIYHGTPKITGGQISDFSTTNYLQFPFTDISRGLPFDIYFSFTTDSDVTTQQNIIDSRFGIALAIQNGKGVMALSSDGISWDIGSSIGTNTLLPNTTYYVKYSWTGTEYNASLSTNDQSYVPDMILASNKSPYKTTIYIGGCDQEKTGHTPHPFKGIINFSKSKVMVNNNVVWEGMADVGIASRANTSLTNLDEVGEARFNAKQDIITSDNAGKNIIITTGSVIPIIPLPDGYTQREFVGNNGTQWIDTGIAVSTLTNPTIETTFRMDEQADADWFGTQTVNSPTIIYNFKNGTASALYFRWGTTTNIASFLTFESGKSLNDFDFSNKMSKLKIDNNNGIPKYYVNDELVATQRTTPVFTNEQTICISRGRGSAKASWQSFKISDNGVDLFDGVPCTRDSDGKGGMYDLITNKFIPSSGGELIVGDIVAEGLKISADLSSKQDVISDLSTIRNGASKGATAIQNTDDCVHKTGDETINGVKTFNGNPVFKSDSLGTQLTVSRNDTTGYSSIAFANQDVIKGHIGISADNKPVHISSDKTTARNIVTNSVINTAVGSATKPVYVDANGVTTAITSYEGNSATATKATQDGNGNEITTAYMPLNYSEYSITTHSTTNKYIKLATFTVNGTANYDLSNLFWVEALNAGTSKNYALVKLNARWGASSYASTVFQILEKYGPNSDIFNNLVWAYNYTTSNSKGNLTGEIWMTTSGSNYWTYYFRPTQCNEYGDYSRITVNNKSTTWTYYNKSGVATSVADTEITPEYIQVAINDISQRAIKDGDGNTISSTYVKLSGDQTISGKKTFTGEGGGIYIERDSGDAYLSVKRTDIDKTMRFGIGSGGANRGIWDTSLNKWAFNLNASGKPYILDSIANRGSAGSATKPVYINADGIATACSTSAVLKTSYVSGTSGYNIWSNGYCEQWGEVTVTGGQYATMNVSLLKTFKDTNYNVNITIKSATADTTVSSSISTTSTVDTLVIRKHWTLTGQIILWNVRGYLASGQY